MTDQHTNHIVTCKSDFKRLHRQRADHQSSEAPMEGMKGIIRAIIYRRGSGAVICFVSVATSHSHSTLTVLR
jgi:hypothetical protein